jgi:hypothetical protein
MVWLYEQLISNKYVYLMKIKTEYLLGIAILVVIILLTLTRGFNAFKPFSKNNIFSQHSPYEGFANVAYSEYGANAPSISAKEDGATPVDYGKYVTAPAKKVEGFQGLQSSPYSDEKPIDIFSQSAGSAECQASGYTNSKGNLCLDDNQMKMLMTRGGNLTGADSQIGN